METFTMSRKKVPRADLVGAALDGKITNAEGACALRISVRQFKRLKGRLRAEGVGGGGGGGPAAAGGGPAPAATAGCSKRRSTAGASWPTRTAIASGS